MFLKISEFKKAMKSTLKTSGGLVIGNVKGHFLVHASLWGVWVESIYATSKFKAAIVDVFCQALFPKKSVRIPCF